MPSGIATRYASDMDVQEIRRARLIRLIESMKTQKAFADATDLAPAHVSQMVNGVRQMGRDVARRIERLLKLPHGEMDRPLDEPNVLPAAAHVSSVPLISWVQAGSWCEIVDSYAPGEGEKPVYTTKRVGPHAFALRVRGDSMENPKGRPSYPEGSIIIVDPDRPAVSGSRVVVRLEDSEEATFKVYVEDAGRRYLKPLNPQYPIIEVTGLATICGVVVQTIIEED